LRTQVALGMYELNSRRHMSNMGCILQGKPLRQKVQSLLSEMVFLSP